MEAAHGTELLECVFLEGGDHVVCSCHPQGWAMLRLKWEVTTEGTTLGPSLIFKSHLVSEVGPS